jgi:hypothetical protein
MGRVSPARFNPCDNRRWQLGADENMTISRGSNMATDVI